MIESLLYSHLYFVFILRHKCKLQSSLPARSTLCRAISSNRHVSYDRFDSASFDNAAVGFKGF